MIKESVYKIFVKRNERPVLIGNVTLKTAKAIHGNTIIQTNHSVKTIFLDPEKTPYGK